MSSALSQRITEQQIKEDNQRLRDERGIARSPGQDHETEEEELNTFARYNENKENAVNASSLSEHLDYHITKNVDAAFMNNKEMIDDLGSIFPNKPILPNVIDIISNTAKTNTYKFMIDIVPILLNNDDTIDEDYILSLTNDIFIFSLIDIVYGYQTPTIMSNPKYRKIIQSRVKNRLDTLRDDMFDGEFPQNEVQLFVNGINTLVVKNIRDGISINNNGDRKRVRIMDGGKTKRRGYKHRKTYSRPSKKGLTFKQKKQRTRRSRVRTRV
jgi:hypothetical protein